MYSIVVGLSCSISEDMVNISIFDSVPFHNFYNLVILSFYNLKLDNFLYVLHLQLYVL